MIKTAKKLKIYLYTTFAVSAAAMILTSLSYFLSFDAVGYFNYGTTPFPWMLNVLCIASAITAVVSVLLIPGNALDGATPTTLVTSVCATPIAAAFAAFGGFLLVAYLQLEVAPRSFLEVFPSFATKNAPSLILMLCGVFLIISAVYYALTWSTSAVKSSAHPLLGFAPPLAGACLIGLIYFDFYVAMNSPLKIHFQLTILFFMLFMLFEVRASLGKPRPRGYLAISALTVLAASVSSVPQIAAYVGGRIDSVIHLIYALLTLGILIYTAGRLAVFVSARCLLERISDQTYTEEDLFPIEENETNEDTEEKNEEELQITEDKDQ